MPKKKFPKDIKLLNLEEVNFLDKTQKIKRYFYNILIIL